ncbi:Uncharacterised protein [Klebsiella pneumoniae]|uniref:Uncharacterized protein n=1 Tax=Klebsiella pneumoniae TaxID=573 RepID=A0A2X3ITG9_KLEPN|nr:Uncharacterised protein [Klebsiella pneumoniae]
MATQEIGIWLGKVRIGDAISCASARFLAAEGLFRHAALDGDGLNVAGSFAENLVKSLQNCPEFWRD